jgi:outer membrane receptor protein involved in Fe transport
MKNMQPIKFWQSKYFFKGMMGLGCCIGLLFAGQRLQAQNATLFAKVVYEEDKMPAAFANVLMLAEKEDAFLQGTLTNENGEFVFEGVSPGSYTIQISFMGYQRTEKSIVVGKLSPYYDLGTLFLKEQDFGLQEVLVQGRKDEIRGNLDRKVFDMGDNLTQMGGSLLQAMQNLPGVEISRDGKLMLRGSDKIAVLLDGQQSAITGIASQEGLDNIPVAMVERIEIINNPSSKYDANAMAGIINIVLKKEEAKGWNGRLGMAGGLGSLWEKRPNIFGIRDQYRFTPNANPSLSLNYKKKDFNFFVSGDLLWHQKITRNEFIQREYAGGETVDQQFLENRTQPIYNIKAGFDWKINNQNDITFFGLYNLRAYTDLGDLPYLSGSDGSLLRYWKYYEYEANKTFQSSILHRYKFSQPGHKIETAVNYSFRRKEEVFNFSDLRLGLMGTDTTQLLADENMVDVTVDYTKPLARGRYEAGLKGRARVFPNQIDFIPGENSILDLSLQGSAEYREWLYALYGNYIFESGNLSLEGGLRAEYAQVDYLVDPNHGTYSSDGFDYLELFPSFRMGYRLRENSSLSVFYNRRVDRPEEKNLRVFPQYSDPEILPLGNPGLLPQFTQSMEIAHKLSWEKGYFYLSLYHRISRQILTRILTQIPESTLFVLVDQNAGRGYNSGTEWVLTQALGKGMEWQFNGNVYKNTLEAFSIFNAYPSRVDFSEGRRSNYTGNGKLTLKGKIKKAFQWQMSFLYFAADILPQGRIEDRYALDIGATYRIQSGQGEFFFNASDVFNTMRIKIKREGEGFLLQSVDLYETQIFRLGYQYRF